MYRYVLYLSRSFGFNNVAANSSFYLIIKRDFSEMENEIWMEEFTGWSIVVNWAFFDSSGIKYKPKMGIPTIRP